MAEQHKPIEATREFDAPPVPAKPRVVQLAVPHDASVSLMALTSDGSIFERVRDPNAMNQPGVHMIWRRIPGPV